MESQIAHVYHEFQQRVDIVHTYGMIEQDIFKIISKKIDDNIFRLSSRIDKPHYFFFHYDDFDYVFFAQVKKSGKKDKVSRVGRGYPRADVMWIKKNFFLENDFNFIDLISLVSECSMHEDEKKIADLCKSFIGDIKKGFDYGDISDDGLKIISTAISGKKIIILDLNQKIWKILSFIPRSILTELNICAIKDIEENPSYFVYDIEILLNPTVALDLNISKFDEISIMNNAKDYAIISLESQKFRGINEDYNSAISCFFDLVKKNQKDFLNKVFDSKSNLQEFLKDLSDLNNSIDKLSTIQQIIYNFFNDNSLFFDFNDFLRNKDFFFEELKHLKTKIIQSKEDRKQIMNDLLEAKIKLRALGTRLKEIPQKEETLKREIKDSQDTMPILEEQLEKCHSDIYEKEKGFKKLERKSSHLTLIIDYKDLEGKISKLEGGMEDKNREIENSQLIWKRQIFKSFISQVQFNLKIPPSKELNKVEDSLNKLEYKIKTSKKQIKENSNIINDMKIQLKQYDNNKQREEELNLKKTIGKKIQKKIFENNGRKMDTFNSVLHYLFFLLRPKRIEEFIQDKSFLSIFHEINQLNLKEELKQYPEVSARNLRIFPEQLQRFLRVINEIKGILVENLEKIDKFKENAEIYFEKKKFYDFSNLFIDNNNRFKINNHTEEITNNINALSFYILNWGYKSNFENLMKDYIKLGDQIQLKSKDINQISKIIKDLLPNLEFFFTKFSRIKKKITQLQKIYDSYLKKNLFIQSEEDIYSNSKILKILSKDLIKTCGSIEKVIGNTKFKANQLIERKENEKKKLIQDISKLEQENVESSSKESREENVLRKLKAKREILLKERKEVQKSTILTYLNTMKIFFHDNFELKIADQNIKKIIDSAFSVEEDGQILKVEIIQKILNEINTINIIEEPIEMEEIIESDNFTSVIQNIAKDITKNDNQISSLSRDISALKNELIVVKNDFKKNGFSLDLGILNPNEEKKRVEKSLKSIETELKTLNSEIENTQSQIKFLNDKNLKDIGALKRLIQSKDELLAKEQQEKSKLDRFDLDVKFDKESLENNELFKKETLIQEIYDKLVKIFKANKIPDNTPALVLRDSLVLIEKLLEPSLMNLNPIDIKDFCAKWNIHDEIESELLKNKDKLKYLTNFSNYAHIYNELLKIHPKIIF